MDVQKNIDMMTLIHKQEIKNSLEVQNKQDNDIDKQKVKKFPSHIEIQNHISCLKHYNDFMKNASFEFNCCFFL